MTKEFCDPVDDITLLLAGQFGVNRQGKHLFSRSFRDRECPFLVTQIAIAILQMHGQRIIDFCSDSIVFQERSQFIPLLHPDGVLVVDVEIAWRRGRQNHPILKLRPCEELPVARSVATPAFGPLIEVLELDMEDGGLQCIKPAIDSDCLMQVPHTAAMDPKHRDRFRETIIVRGDDTAITEPTEVLGREKAETTRVPEDAGSFPLLRGT